MHVRCKQKISKTSSTSSVLFVREGLNSSCFLMTMMCLGLFFFFAFLLLLLLPFGLILNVLFTVQETLYNKKETAPKKNMNEIMFPLKWYWWGAAVLYTHPTGNVYVNREKKGRRERATSALNIRDTTKLN